MNNCINSHPLSPVGFGSLNDTRGKKKRELSHFAGSLKCNYESILQRSRARSKYVTPMSFSWHTQVLQLSSDESKIGGRVWSTTPRRLKEKLRQRPSWMGDWTLSQSRWHLYWSLRWLMDLYIVPDVGFHSRLIWNSSRSEIDVRPFRLQGANVTLASFTTRARLDIKKVYWTSCICWVN